MAMKKSASLDDALRSVELAAPGLRRAGVLSISVGDVSATLAPAPPPEPRKGKAAVADPEFGDVAEFSGRKRDADEDEEMAS